MPRVVSFLVLAAVLLLIGSMFFKVVLQFAVPLFLAAVLVVVFKPLHRWALEKFPTRPRLAAMATTIAILLVVLLPAIWLGWNSYHECRQIFGYLEDPDNRANLVAKIDDRATRLRGDYERLTGQPLEVKGVVEQAVSLIGGALLSSVQAAFHLVVGLAIMLLAVYYFFVDGPTMIVTAMRLSPLDDRYERELLERFANVSRSVVLASLLSAIAQGLLAGAGYFFALSDEAPGMLLTMLTMLLALVPFVGAASVWIPTCLWIWLFEHRLAAACILAGYCAAVVSNIDNLIKPLVLHGQANLHPLLALISVLGGVQVLGPIGILVGPMLVAFVQALLVMVNRELQLWSEGDESRTTSEPNHEPLADQSKALSERPIRDHPSTDLDETSFDSDSSASVSDASPRGKSSPINPRRAGKRRRRRKRR